MTMMPIHHSGRWRYEYPSPSKPCRSLASLRPFLVMTKLDPAAPNNQRLVSRKGGQTHRLPVSTLWPALGQRIFPACRRAPTIKPGPDSAGLDGRWGGDLGRSCPQPRGRSQSRVVSSWQARGASERVVGSDRERARRGMGQIMCAPNLWRGRMAGCDSQVRPEIAMAGCGEGWGGSEERGRRCLVGK
jgi:hypothetical protein